MLGKYKLRVLLVALALLFLSSEVQSQSYTVIGCVSDDTGFLYTGPSGVNSPRSGGYGPAYETTPVVTSGQIGTGIYCSPVNLGVCVIRARTRCSECTGPYDYDPSWRNKDEYYEQAGVLRGYMMCPIDDYVGFILVAIGALGFFVVRKNFLLS
ncbi:MAG: hypothetical protein ACQUHE_05320 [Bacteroidia bacterium]